ncbi:PREDICTED: telomere repeat-binding factor 2-like [Populus euphratica]|uniref:MYB transcription factor n=1 Tax=Populus euphratica TaxID=75702 RepID=A0AAJ6TJU6_POPEU|nr:PREDICTED: telomere repeat-binding factor 2-like [Populus euphratica]
MDDWYRNGTLLNFSLSLVHPLPLLLFLASFHHQKWTAEEEAALKAGVLKHGTGKWRTILVDPEFSAVLRLRSNVDLKDKWRNINVTAIWGSRKKAKIALKRRPLTPKREENAKALSTVVQTNEEVVDAKPLAFASGTPGNGGPKDLLARLDNLILEAITTLKEPTGSDRASIALYIQEKYWAPMNLRKILGGKLKHLTANGNLIMVQHKYRIAPSSTFSEGRKNHALPEGKRKDALKLEKSKNKILTKAHVGRDPSKIQGMTALEAAASAAKAVAEAESAIADAEAAAREAEKAEAEAEAAQVFAKAAMEAFKLRARHTWWPFVFRMRIMPAMICSAIGQECFSVNSSGKLKFLITFIHSFS